MTGVQTCALAISPCAPCVVPWILTELGGFEVKESKFRREMEKLRNLQSRDLALEVDRDRDQLIQQTMRQLNTHFGRRCTTTPMAVHRVKVTFKDEPGEGSGVARSFYTAIALAFLSNDKLPNLDCVQSVKIGRASCRERVSSPV